MHTVKKRTYTIQTVEHALNILEAISDAKGEVHAVNLSKQLKMNKSSLFRFLTTFTERGYLEASVTSGKYRVGLSAFVTSRKLLLQMELLSKAKPVMEQLVRDSNETVYLAVPVNDEILMLDAVMSTHKIQVFPLVGKRYPLEGISAGKLVLAHRHAPHETPELDDIRLQQACIDYELLGEGVCNIAVPLFNARKEIAGSLCLVGPAYRFTKEMVEGVLLSRIKAAGQAISSSLGYFGHLY